LQPVFVVKEMILNELRDPSSPTGCFSFTQSLRFPFSLGNLGMVCEIGRDELMTILREHPRDKDLLNPLLAWFFFSFGSASECWEQVGFPTT